MNLKFKGKSAIISGGSGGMGLAIVGKLIEAKIRILIIDIKEPPKKILNNKLISFAKIDLTEFIEIKKTVKKFTDSTKRVDYLINAAGILMFNEDIGVEKINIKVWNKVFDINLTSMVYLLKCVIPFMKKNKYGAIVNISSISGVVGQGYIHPGYNASKGAVRTMTKQSAVRFAKDGIRVNSVHPGILPAMRTSGVTADPVHRQKILDAYVPMKRAGEVEEVGRAVLFLASDDASYITGAELPVDGGYLAI